MIRLSDRTGEQLVAFSCCVCPTTQLYKVQLRHDTTERGCCTTPFAMASAEQSASGRTTCLVPSASLISAVVWTTDHIQSLISWRTASSPRQVTDRLAGQTQDQGDALRMCCSATSQRPIQRFAVECSGCGAHRLARVRNGYVLYVTCVRSDELNCNGRHFMSHACSLQARCRTIGVQQ